MAFIYSPETFFFYEFSCCHGLNIGGLTMNWENKGLLNPPSHGKGAHAYPASRVPKDFQGAGFQRGPRREHVVDKQHMFANHFCGRVLHERLFHVLHAFEPVETGL